MTVFDAIRNGEVFDEDICPTTGIPHDFILDDVVEEDGRIKETLICLDCGFVSEGWRDE